MSVTSRSIASVVVVVALHVSSLGAAPPADIVQYLARVANFSQTDITAVENGAVIARVVPGSSDSKVMVVAAVKIRASRDQTVSYYGQLISYVDGQVTTAFGRFSSPPSLNDVK